MGPSLWDPESISVATMPGRNTLAVFGTVTSIENVRVRESAAGAIAVMRPLNWPVAAAVVIA